MAQRVVKEKPKGNYLVVRGNPYQKDVLCFIGANEATMKLAFYQYGLSKAECDEILKCYNEIDVAATRYEYIEMGAALTVKLNTGKQCVFFSSKIKKDPGGIATVTHEMFHATCAIMQQIGMGELTGSNEEAWAYLQDSLVKQFWAQLKK